MTLSQPSGAYSQLVSNLQKSSSHSQPDPKSHPCPVCGERFGEPDEVTAHLQNHHPSHAPALVSNAIMFETVEKANAIIKLRRCTGCKAMFGQMSDYIAHRPCFFKNSPYKDTPEELFDCGYCESKPVRGFDQLVLHYTAHFDCNLDKILPLMYYLPE
jgi:hypothetical protein